MTLPLTPDTLRAAYDYLVTTPPFAKWNMPDSEDVIFRVTRHRDRLAHYVRDKAGRNTIVVSSHLVGRSHSLIETMAHEMVHLHQAEAGMENAAQHNAAFRKLATKVCEVHGFDAKVF